MNCSDRSHQDMLEQTKRTQFEKELPGTIGCVAVFFLLAVIACCLAIASPIGLVIEIAFTLIYIGLLRIYGQGSIIEMGLFCAVLLVLTCMLVINLRLWADYNQKNKSQNNGMDAKGSIDAP